MGWLEGGLRLMPPWEIRAFGFEIPNPFFPGVLLPGGRVRDPVPLARSSRPGGTRDTASTTSWTGPATGRCAPGIGVAAFTFVA